MKYLFDLIFNNKEWLFSGLLVAVPIALIGWFLLKRKKEKTKKQVIKVKGDKNVTAGRDVNIE